MGMLISIRVVPATLYIFPFLPFELNLRAHFTVQSNFNFKFFPCTQHFLDCVPSISQPEVITYYVPRILLDLCFLKVIRILFTDQVSLKERKVLLPANATDPS